MLNKEITVEYSDQNESFKRFLPRLGRVIREVSLEDWGKGWYLLELDEPFDYQHKLAEPYVFKGVHITHLLIKSRTKDVEISEGQPVSVFVLLVPDLATLSKSNISSKDLIHACWGTAHIMTSADFSKK